MSEELENKNESLSAGQNEGGREGYKQTEGFNSQQGGRPMRPRIRVQRAYTPNRSYNNDEGGFRPEGFGSGLQSQGSAQRPYRPRYNAGQQGGYQPRQGGYHQRPDYQQQRPQGYRPRYGNDGEEGYQPRQGQYGQRPQTGYRPHYNTRASTASVRRRVTARATTPDSRRAAISPAKAATIVAATSVTSTASPAPEATTAREVTVSARPITTPTQSTVLRNALNTKSKT